jgi:IS4 transposase
MLYRQRWRIEEAFWMVKRLLGLSSFWCGAQNAVELPIWATGWLYAVLIDLVDAVAEARDRPFADISVEMVFTHIRFS